MKFNFIYLILIQITSKKKNLYGTVDKINKKMGRDKVQILGQGIAKRWVLKRERLSPSYTTRWDELLKVHC